MSRVHDALRKAGQENTPAKGNAARSPSDSDLGHHALADPAPGSSTVAVQDSIAPATLVRDPYWGLENLEACIQSAQRIPFNPLERCLVRESGQAARCSGGGISKPENPPEPHANGSTVAYISGYKCFSRRG